MITKNLLACVLCLSFFSAYAQDQVIDSSAYKRQVDVKDILHRWFGKHKPEKNNSLSDFQFALLPAIGYTSSTGFAISIGANAVFKLKGSQKESDANTSLTYTQFNQILLPLSANIWSKDDRFNFILDNKYINFPSPLYGLRGRSRLNRGYAVNFSWIKLHEMVLMRIAKDFYGGAGLFYDQFWNISEKGVPPANAGPQNPLGISTAFEHYVHAKLPPTRESAFGPALRLLFDSRDNPINPWKGFYGSAIYHPVFKNKTNDSAWTNWVIDLRKYFSLSDTRENVIALWTYLWMDVGKPSFLLLPSTGWDEYWNTGRGYSQGRYRGKTMHYFEAEYRFQLTHNGLLGGVVFSNLQNFPSELYTSYSERHFKIQSSVTALGGGLGLRLKFNKYSRTNVALDAGFGQSFPKPWFSVNLGEVF